MSETSHDDLVARPRTIRWQPQRRAFGALLFVLALISSCGGGSPAKEASSGGASELPAWKDMNREQRLEFMGTTVQPAMEKLFKEYDPVGFKVFKCQTCHGPDMRAVDYRLPNGLYALPETGTLEASKDYDERMTQFMLEQVTPKMAELLGMEPGKSFGCFSCHEKE